MLPTDRSSVAGRGGASAPPARRAALSVGTSRGAHASHNYAKFYRFRSDAAREGAGMKGACWA